MIPVLNPAGVQEILDYGLYGWAMSRYSGCWVGFKAASPRRSIARPRSRSTRTACSIALPNDFEMPPGGLNIRWPDPLVEQELPAAALQALCRARLRARQQARPHRHRQPEAPPRHRHHGQVLSRRAPGPRRSRHRRRAWPPRSASASTRSAMPWPLEREGARHFAEGLEEILVVEEKRALIENQLKEQLYNWREDVRPRVIGKFDEKSEWILPSAGELTPAQIARVIAGAHPPLLRPRPESKSASPFIEAKERALAASSSSVKRIAVFLLRLPAQHLDQGAGGQPRAGRHRLPLHGALDGPQHRRPSRRWAAKARPGSARRRSPTRSTSSPISATAPTSTRARWRSAPRSPRASTSPTRSSTTTRSP